jgi:hypothetical protein
VIIVGCPVYERAWVLNQWFDHLANTTQPLHFIFNYTPGTDNTLETITHRANKFASVEIIETTTGTHSTDRNWGERARIETLVDLRNNLLDAVCAQSPDYFFSLDSDILVPKNVFTAMIEAVKHYDAVSPLVYLGQGSITNGFTYDGHVRRRLKVYNALQVSHVICAAKFMTPDVYRNVRYEYHPQGEDIAWSDNARGAGFRLGVDSSVRCKHVMYRRQLEEVDSRVGF